MRSPRAVRVCTSPTHPPVAARPSVDAGVCARVAAGAALRACERAHERSIRVSRSSEQPKRCVGTLQRCTPRRSPRRAALRSHDGCAAAVTPQPRRRVGNCTRRQHHAARQRRRRRREGTTTLQSTARSSWGAASRLTADYPTGAHRLLARARPTLAIGVSVSARPRVATACSDGVRTARYSTAPSPRRDAGCCCVCSTPRRCTGGTGAPCC